MRDDGPAAAARRLAEAVPYRDQGVVAVGLGGSEARFPAGLVADVATEAARQGCTPPG